ncbi:unnamed protein product [Urochloa decumbens]|uniref:PGG domain-containing protein n=1 Tax=Urochloa decumbens TaxID=240449 RepID=A0ABC9E655_9POAL
MSVEITMDPICSPPPSLESPPTAGEVADDVKEAPTVNCKPMYVFVSPGVVPGDGAEAATVVLPPAYAGVVYLHQHHERRLMGEERVNDDPKKKREKWLNEMRGWLIVVAVLIASITYQAGLNPPGGFQQETDPTTGLWAGDPVLKSISPIRYIAFFYLNATAFLSSLAIIALLMKESFYHSELKVEALEFIVVFDLVVLAGAYLVGTTRSIQMSLYANGFAMAVLFFFYAVYTMQFLFKLCGSSL